MRNTDSQSYNYARQILGLPIMADLPQELEDKIYYALKALHTVRSGKELSLESVALLTYPWLKLDYEKRIAASLAEEKAYQEKKEVAKKTARKKAAVRRKVAAEAQEAEKAAE